ncbi:DUF5710 domain-containing protein [Propionivibrio sp.]|uniref:DUF5710 domain-containing protein n=1 Tax=Propionivibrio sp. TaxID=2212460 RepID=UPI003BF1E20B
MLEVPYSDRNKAKALGCRWSGAEKRWYIDNPDNLLPLMRWMPAHMKKAHIAKR